MTHQIMGAAIVALILAALFGALTSCALDGWRSADPGVYRDGPRNGAGPG